jgi:hypothetical protein
LFLCLIVVWGAIPVANQDVVWWLSRAAAIAAVARGNFLILDFAAALSRDLQIDVLGETERCEFWRRRQGALTGTGFFRIGFHFSVVTPEMAGRRSRKSEKTFRKAR